MQCLLNGYWSVSLGKDTATAVAGFCYKHFKGLTRVINY